MNSREVVLKIRRGIKMGSLTDIGCYRENNEDRCQYWEPESDEEFEQKGRLAIVADGMGGCEGGQEASRIAVETIAHCYAESQGDPQFLLLEGFRSAHLRILQQADETPIYQGMGTTCTAVAVVGSNLFYAHIGDSRLYLLRAGKISQVTQDDSYVSRLVETGLISSKEAETHPHRNVLTAALGAGVEIAPEYPADPMHLEAEDVIILCTDGLWGVVSDAAIQSAAGNKDVQKICKHLVQTAKEHGGPDNITVMVIRVE